MHILFGTRRLVAGLLIFSSALAGPHILYPIDIVGLEPDVLKQNGYEVVAITEDQWRRMSPGHFATFDAVVIGDPFCATEIPSFINETIPAWAPAINGNIMIAGNSPSSAAQKGVAEAEDFIAAAVDFVTAKQGTTGLYFSLSCYYKGHTGEPQLVEELAYFGPFTVFGSNAAGPKNVHTEAWHPALEGLSEEVLSEWNSTSGDVSSQDDYFHRYPDTGSLGFEAYAILPTEDDDPMASHFQDGISGLPYILTRGASPRFCGDGEPQKIWKEECDEGSERNGHPDSLCNESCKCKYGVVLDWKNGDPETGSWVTSCVKPEEWSEKHSGHEPEKEASVSIGYESLQTNKEYRNHTSTAAGPAATSRTASSPLAAEDVYEIFQTEILDMSTSILPDPSNTIVDVEVAVLTDLEETVMEDDETITRTVLVSATTRSLLAVDGTMSALNFGLEPLPFANQPIDATSTVDPETTAMTTSVFSVDFGLGDGFIDMPLSFLPIPGFGPMSTETGSSTPTSIFSVDFGLGDGFIDMPLSILPIPDLNPAPVTSTDMPESTIPTSMSTVLIPSVTTGTGVPGGVESEATPPMATFDGAASEHGVRVSTVLGVAVAVALVVGMIWV